MSESKATPGAAVAVLATCRCNCGYRCGGPGRCALGVFECLRQPTGHFERDCDHKWDGPVWTSQDRSMSSITCSACGMTAIGHDSRVGP